MTKTAKPKPRIGLPLCGKGLDMSDGKSPDDWPALTTAFCDAVRAAIEAGMPPDEVIDRLTEVVGVIAGDVEDLQRKARIAGSGKKTG